MVFAAALGIVVQRSIIVRNLHLPSLVVFPDHQFDAVFILPLFDQVGQHGHAVPCPVLFCLYPDASVAGPAAEDFLKSAVILGAVIVFPVGHLVNIVCRVKLQGIIADHAGLVVDQGAGLGIDNQVLAGTGLVIRLLLLRAGIVLAR